MPRGSATAKFPTTKVAAADLGIVRNLAATTLTADAASGATTFNLNSLAEVEVNQWLTLRGINGHEVVQVSAVDGAALTATVTRAKDGSVAVAHKQGQGVRGAVPAIMLNQLASEVVALESFLGADGDTITWNRALRLRYTGTASPTLEIGFNSTKADPETVVSFTRTTDGGTNWTEVGAIKYDPTNDQLEFHDIVVTVGSGANLLFEDDRQLRFGTDSDYWLHYVNASTRLALTSTNVDGAGADGDVFRVADGSDDIVFLGGLSTDGRAAVTTGLDTGGPVRVGGVVVLEADRDLAVDWLPDADATLDLGSSTRRFAEAHLSGFLAVGTTPATAGAVRLANNAWVTGRNAANAANLNLLSVDASDVLQLYNGVLSLTSTGALDIDAAFSIGTTTVFEADRDVAIPLLPNADDSLDVGSSGRRWQDAFLSGVLQVSHAVAGQAAIQLVAPAATGGATLQDSPAVDLVARYWDGATSQNRTATLIHNVTASGGSPASQIDFYIAGASRASVYDTGRLEIGGPFSIGGVSVFEADRDVGVTLLPNASATLDLGSSTRVWNAAHIRTINVDNQGAGADPVLSSNNAAQVLDLTGALAVSSHLAIAGVTLFEADRDVAVTLLPNADATLALGSTSRRWTDLFLSGNIEWKSGTGFVGTFDHAITGDRTWTFPDTAGTVALTTDTGFMLLGRDGAVATDLNHSTTYYLAFATGSNSPSTTEADEEMQVAGACSITDVFLRVSFNNTDNTTTFTLRKNGADTALTGTMAANTTGTVTFTGGPVSFAKGDRIALKAAVGAGGVGDKMQANYWGLTGRLTA